ncbi:hypothetical protein GCM10009759_47960 [Kitasatospora saccharophila]|uniref:Uncharacterized protein n=1 Tax=Kitasatospora saccharophila TaxID=407973 RepID=A0ABN2XDG6_9ACTN
MLVRAPFDGGPGNPETGLNRRCASANLEARLDFSTGAPTSARRVPADRPFRRTLRPPDDAG